MDVSIPINISTNAWNIIKFMAMYVLLDTTIPILLESIDKASIVRRFSCDGRVPISNFTKHRHARSGVREIVAHMLRRFRKRPSLRRSQHALKMRPILLFSLWIASIIGEYGSGSGPRITQIEVPQISAPVGSLLQAMFACVKAEHGENSTLLRLSVRNATMTREGLKCSCSYEKEVGCTMPLQVQRMDVISTIPLQGREPGNLRKPLIPGRNFPLFSSSGPLLVEKHREYANLGPYTQYESQHNGANHIDYVLVQGHANHCNMCSYLPIDVGPADPILFRFYGIQDHGGKFLSNLMFTGKLSTGTVVGLAVSKGSSLGELDTLDDLFEIDYFSMVSFLPGIWERPGWQNRSFVTNYLTVMRAGIANKTFQEENFLGLERQPDFSGIWTAWSLFGHINDSLSGTVTLNTSSAETATISLLGIFSFSYLILVFLVLLVWSMLRKKYWRALKTNGFGNVEWLISALIAQQQPRGSSLRGVDDFKQFDLTVVKRDNDVPHVRAQHWVASLSLASRASNLDVIDAKADPEEDFEYIL